MEREQDAQQARMHQTMLEDDRAALRDVRGVLAYLELPPSQSQVHERDCKQGLTLVNFSAQPEPFLTQNTALTTPDTTSHHVNTPKQPLHAPLSHTKRLR
jgi:hypothetical protein